MAKLVFGCGYLGQRVAQRWREAGFPVVAITRSSWYPPERNLHAFNADVLDLKSLVALRNESLSNAWQVDALLYSVGHDPTARNCEVYATGLKNALASMPSSIERVIYISTTGVYGSAGGEWIDELTPPDPQREGGRASLAAEKMLAAHPLGRQSIILRLAGIYGPGRVPFIDRLRDAEPIPAPVKGYLNLIHVDDAASVVISADRLEPFDDGPRVYCVSDGHPVVRGDFYREVARQIGAPPPTFVTPESNSPRTARAAANRRVRNARMLNELRVKLAYPDYRAGLSATLETQNQLGIG
jgi:nucleoside-diphosphate-sugar epimerase